MLSSSFFWWCVVVPLLHFRPFPLDALRGFAAALRGAGLPSRAPLRAPLAGALVRRFSPAGAAFFHSFAALAAVLAWSGFDALRCNRASPRSLRCLTRGKCRTRLLSRMAALCIAPRRFARPRCAPLSHGCALMGGASSLTPASRASLLDAWQRRTSSVCSPRPWCSVRSRRSVRRRAARPLARRRPPRASGLCPLGAPALRSSQGLRPACCGCARLASGAPRRPWRSAAVVALGALPGLAACRRCPRSLPAAGARRSLAALGLSRLRRSAPQTRVAALRALFPPSAPAAVLLSLAGAALAARHFVTRCKVAQGLHKRRCAPSLHYLLRVRFCNYGSGGRVCEKTQYPVEKYQSSFIDVISFDIYLDIICRIW